MIIGITGHTRGLGLELSKHFNIINGFSRSNGYDISYPDKIVQECLDYDVFINNAFDWNNGFAQTELLQTFYDYNYQGLIINIASSIETVVRSEVRQYDIHKRSLIDCSKQLYYLGFKTCVISPGAIDVGSGKNFKGNKLNTASIINCIDLILKEKCTIQHIILTGRLK